MGFRGMCIYACLAVLLSCLGGCGGTDAPVWSRVTYSEGNLLCGPTCQTTWTFERDVPAKLVVDYNWGTEGQVVFDATPDDWDALVSIVGGSEFFNAEEGGFPCECLVSDEMDELSLDTEDGRHFSREVACCIYFEMDDNQPRALRTILYRYLPHPAD
jgi:hypothetical protein